MHYNRIWDLIILLKMKKMIKTSYLDGECKYYVSIWILKSSKHIFYFGHQSYFFCLSPPLHKESSYGRIVILTNSLI